MNPITWLPSFNGPTIMSMQGAGIYWFHASMKPFVRDAILNMVIVAHEEQIDRIDALIDAISTGIQTVPLDHPLRPWRDLGFARPSDGTRRTIWLTTAYEDVEVGGDSVVIPLERGHDVVAISDICRSGLIVTSQSDGSRVTAIFESIREAALEF